MFEIASGPYVTTVTVSGMLDLSARTSFPEILTRVHTRPHKLLAIDICAVRTLDSTGAAFLISLAQAESKRGRVTVLRGCTSEHRIVLSICGATDAFRYDKLHLCA